MSTQLLVKPGDKIKSKTNKEYVVLDVRTLFKEHTYVMVEERKGWWFHVNQFKLNSNTA